MIVSGLINLRDQINPFGPSEWIYKQLDALIQGHGWQLIKTAPVDEWVLLWCPIEYDKFRVAYWSPLDGSWMDSLEEIGEIPTHWMSLPDPPTNTGK